MKVEMKIKSIVEHIDSLPKRDRLIVLEYLEYNEWGVVLDHLCYTLGKEDIQISESIYKQTNSIL